MNNTIEQIYDQIESIKQQLNGLTHEQAIVKRLNLQDLYHQVILGSLDFTIDKKLELDLWNNVFKTQISHYQTQIKDKKNTKRNEAQASFNFFLEASRGFYTKLLQDIVFTYKIDIEFCQRPTYLMSNFFNSFEDDHTNEKIKDKQLFYICQNILTHLGDIARYASMFDQAKYYYLHAIKLVPYLGQPYNQIGILFETNRVNQLATVFYYIRSIAVKYPFPLASTNLENFFGKLVDIPLTRYPESVKLTHKDYIQLFLQINALIYTMAKPIKIQSFLCIFKQTSVAHSLSFEKLDCSYLCHMMAILFFMLNRTQNTNFEMYEVTFSLFLCLIEQCVNAALSLNEDSFMLPGFYLAFGFIELLYANKKVPTTINWTNILRVITQFSIQAKTLQDATSIYSIYFDYPLEEERNLDGFMPLKDLLSKLNFKKYNHKRILSESDELQLRKIRLVAIFQRLAEIESLKEFVCFTNDRGSYEFKTHTEVPKPIRRHNVALASLEAQLNQKNKVQSSVTPPSLMRSPITQQSVSRWPQQSPNQLGVSSNLTSPRMSFFNNQSVSRQQYTPGSFPTFLPDTLPQFNSQIVPPQPSKPSQFLNNPQQSQFPSFFESQKAINNSNNVVMSFKQTNNGSIEDLDNVNIWSPGNNQIPKPFNQFPPASSLNKNLVNFK